MNKKMSLAKIIWFGEIASVFALGVFIQAVWVGRDINGAAVFEPTMLYSIITAALFTGGLSFVLKKIFADMEKKHRTEKVENVQAVSRLKLLPMFLSQLISIYGFIAAILSGHANYFWPFAALSLVLLWVHRPVA